jgi:hypothetical protein
VWDDAWTNENAVSLQDVGHTHKPEVITTLGWLLKQDDTGVSLANEFYAETYRGRTFIPAPMIKSILPFKLSKTRPKKEHAP